MSEYPESEKLVSVATEWDTIYEFLDSIPYGLATNDDGYYLSYVNESTEDILYKYFDIDRNKLEKERRRMLDNIRGML